MKKLILIKLLIAFSIMAVSQTGTIIITVKNIDVNAGGTLSTGIFTEEHFPEIGMATYEKETTIDSTTMTIVFDAVNPGKYGISSYQDEDNNNNLGTNFMGFPREPVGFSNDARIKMGPPAFSDAMIELKAGETLKVEILLC